VGGKNGTLFPHYDTITREQEAASDHAALYADINLEDRPVLESEFCSGQEPAPGGQLIFLGRYYLTSSAPSGFPTTCPTRETSTSPLCRFEVIVQDNDRNRAPSIGDSFSIKLSNVTVLTSQFPDPATVPYARAGLLSSGNITVD
jgi:hypothetical protein